jgi:hypothetical protein
MCTPLSVNYCYDQVTLGCKDMNGTHLCRDILNDNSCKDITSIS